MSRLANKPKIFYNMHLRYGWGDLGLTEIERDEDVEGLPYFLLGQRW